jgi:Flp pilus assembly pilin Flp
MKLDNRGQALVEYLLIIAVISVIVVSLVRTFGGYLQDSMTQSACTMTDRKYIPGDKPGEGYCDDDFDF